MAKKKQIKQDSEKKEKIEDADLQTSQESRKFWNRFYTGTVLIFIAVVLIVACFGANFFPVLQPLKIFLEHCLGRCTFLLPVIFGVLGVCIFADHEFHLWDFKTFGLFLLVIAITSGVHHRFVPMYKELYPEMLSKGGGFLGGFITLLLHRFFENDATTIIICGMMACGFLLLIPYKDLFHCMIQSFKVKESLDDKEDDEDYIEEFDNERESENSEEGKKTVEKFAANSKKIFSPIKEFSKESDSAVPDSRRLTAREIIANRSNVSVDIKETKKKNICVNKITSIYSREEFKDFTEGIRKESTLKKIFNKTCFSGGNTYDQPEIRHELEDNPVSIPEWQQEKEVVPQEPAPSKVISLFGNKKEEHLEVANKSGDKEEEHFEVVNQIGSQEIKREPKNMVTVVPAAEKIIISHYRNSAEDDVQPKKDEIVDLLTTEKEKSDFQKNSSYCFPNVDLLNKPKHISSEAYDSDIKELCCILEQTLSDFKVRAHVTGVARGPSVTRFEIEPAPGVKVSSITGLSDDIALRLRVGGVRIETSIPGKAAIGVEVPNLQNDVVFFREVVEEKEVKRKDRPLRIGLGKSITGEVITADLDKMPHLLVAGSTGSGKSVCINTIISGILFKAHPEEVKFILIDPKVVELSNYNGIPHLLTPVVTDMKKAASALYWAVKEMERRYNLFAENKVRDISGYNNSVLPKLPYIIIVIDELADLMMVARIDVEDAILRLAQQARAAGIHLVLATQRPSVEIITGIIKANIPSRIAFAVSSQIDSRTILDVGGAEKLIGRGDMLFCPVGLNKPIRVQGAFVSDDEISKIVEFITMQNIPAHFSEEVTTQVLRNDRENAVNVENNFSEDDIFREVVMFVIDRGQVSASMLQRKFRIGYPKASRIVDRLEDLGIVGEIVGSKPRKVIMSRADIEAQFLKEGD